MSSTWRSTFLKSAGVVVLSVVVAFSMTGIKSAAQEKAVGEATFAKDVAPILQRACQNCHRPGSIAPMSLLTYEDARPWARSIKQKVSLREMPPFYVDRNVGIQKFKDDPSLTDEEIAKIVRWVDGGAVLGNIADIPPPRQFEESDKWRIGKPDLIVHAPEYTVAPVAADQWLDLYADSGLTEDRYIKAVETKPSYPAGFRVVHHAHQYMIPPSEEGSEAQEASLNEYSAGKNGDIFPEGSGRLMKAGSKIHFNLHYHSIGETVKDQASVAVVFYPRGVVPKHVLETVNVAFNGTNTELDIPAGASEVRSDGYYGFNTAVKITAFQPHMHNRGKRECLQAIYPDGRMEMLNCVSFNFGWALVYNYADDVAPLLPAGSMLHIINWHDNSPGNRGNPDPRNWAGYGQRTIDDMSFSWVSWYRLTDDEYKQEGLTRSAQQKTSNNQRRP